MYAIMSEFPLFESMHLNCFLLRLKNFDFHISAIQHLTTLQVISVLFSINIFNMYLDHEFTKNWINGKVAWHFLHILNWFDLLLRVVVFLIHLTVFNFRYEILLLPSRFFAKLHDKIIKSNSTCASFRIHIHWQSAGEETKSYNVEPLNPLFVCLLFIFFII